MSTEVCWGPMSFIEEKRRHINCTVVNLIWHSRYRSLAIGTLVLVDEAQDWLTQEWLQTRCNKFRWKSLDLNEGFWAWKSVLRWFRGGPRIMGAGFDFQARFRFLFGGSWKLCQYILKQDRCWNDLSLGLLFRFLRCIVSGTAADDSPSYVPDTSSWDIFWHIHWCQPLLAQRFHWGHQLHPVWGLVGLWWGSRLLVQGRQ